MILRYYDLMTYLYIHRRKILLTIIMFSFWLPYVTIRCKPPQATNLTLTHV